MSLSSYSRPCIEVEFSGQKKVRWGWLPGWGICRGVGGCILVKNSNSNSFELERLLLYKVAEEDSHHIQNNPKKKTFNF